MGLLFPLLQFSEHCVSSRRTAPASDSSQIEPRTRRKREKVSARRWETLCTDYLYTHHRMWRCARLHWHWMPPPRVPVFLFPPWNQAQHTKRPARGQLEEMPDVGAAGVLPTEQHTVSVGSVESAHRVHLLYSWHSPVSGSVVVCVSVA